MWKFIKRRLSANAAPAMPALLPLGEARRVLVVAPHPDDETMGCGGTLALLAQHIEVRVLLVTNGDGAGGLPGGAGDVRKREMAQALHTLGVPHPPICFDEPDGAFRDSPGFRDRFRGVLAEVQPNWVFLPWGGDYHPDHREVSRGCAAALRRSPVEKVLFYEIWTPVPATHVVDIGAVALLKRKALLCHETALACGNYLEATFGMNSYRSIHVSSQAKFAEAFAVRSRAEL